MLKFIELILAFGQISVDKVLMHKFEEQGLEPQTPGKNLGKCDDHLGQAGC